MSIGVDMRMPGTDTDHPERHPPHRGRAAASSHWSVLTPRERQVAAHVTAGATDREIARSLAISPRTVHKHLQQIYRKLDLTNRTGLIVLLHKDRD